MRKCKIWLFALLLCLSACGKKDVNSDVTESDNSSIEDELSETLPKETVSSEVLPTENTMPETPEPNSTSMALHVSGTCLADENENPVQLYGMSTHGLSWFPQYVTYETFQTLRDDWGTNCVRLAMYSGEYNGYCTGGDKEALKNLVKSNSKKVYL